MIRESPLEEASRIIRAHESFMEGEINARMPRGGSGAAVRGTFPVFMVSGQRAETEDRVPTPRDFQLRFVNKGGTFWFTRGRIQAGSWAVVPTVSGIPVGSDAATLPRFSSGGQVFAEYAWTLHPAFVAPDWADVFVSCELIQNGLGAPSPGDVMPATGFNSGVSGTTGIAHSFLMAYDSSGAILTYGQSSLHAPDPNDAFPTDTAIVVQPLVQYVD